MGEGRVHEDDENEDLFHAPSRSINSNGDDAALPSSSISSFSFSLLLRRSNTAGRWTLGLIVLLGVVLIWVFSGVLMQVFIPPSPLLNRCARAWFMLLLMLPFLPVHLHERQL